MTDAMDHPECPVCGKLMVEAHRYLPPTMGGSERRIIAYRFLCSQSDGKGTSHCVELNFPYQEDEE